MRNQPFENGAWVNVQSSHIRAIRFEQEQRVPCGVLSVQFVKGKVFSYEKVPVSTAENFFSAESHGKFFHRYIRDKFPHREIMERT